MSHVYGVPGDFTLKALDHLKDSGLRFVGCCNELNAGYAADGYARARRWRYRKGLGALFTTYGVGELSAANAVAGCFAEHVPMVHIVGTPSRSSLQGSASSDKPESSHRHIHHSMGDGRVGVFREIAEKFTVAQLNLAETAHGQIPDRIDWILSRALQESRPVYIELPSDATDIVPDDSRGPLQEVKWHNEGSADHDEAIQSLSSELLRTIYAAKQPLLLVDRGRGVQDFREVIQDFAGKSNIPTLVMPSGAGMIDASLDNYHGVHSGRIGYVDTSEFVQNADLVLAFGPMFSDTQTNGWSNVPGRKSTVLIEKGRIDGRPVDAMRVISKMTNDIEPGRVAASDKTGLGDYRTNKARHVNIDDPVNQTEFYMRLNSSLRPEDTLILANATPIIGGRDMILPPRTQVIASGMWFSIGHMLPLALGAAQAQEGRTILLEGDGSFQVTAQELSTIIHNRVNMTIFIINNGGYTYERLIHGRHEKYNEIADWDYLAAPQFFGKPPSGYPIKTHRVRTWRDLETVLDSEGYKKGEGLTLVDVIMDKFDIPEKAKLVFENANKAL